ncbi:TPA: hypothetical protein HA235_05565 [Candidatus Woesearchaeota archaeon]|nr:hypothetical protein [Candidatus Woesearchaeota archaeon]HIH32149.1 hypothetical protein [Candidatus Woesearchaeota archaeon]HIH55042.1 hypothetical protein [Candidatus Woesearchaeota archaeon]HIJ02464.1 hypothetical protein [Candidatus Woesearchaeota archaeon]HIJ14656.1 hypothetical protein [Candidatus Woesearchaeota archaeon]
MFIEQLRDVGLSDKEALIYLELLKSQELLVSEISDKTKLNRSSLYSLLESLSNKGFISYVIKNSTRYYRAAEPQKLIQLQREKEKRLSEILPQLIELNKPATKKPIIEILEGIEGIKTIMNDVLRQNKEWFAFNIPGKGPEIIGPNVHAFEKERQKQKILLNVICIKTSEGVKRGKEFSNMKHTKVKYMPKEYDSPASNWIYADRLAIIFWYRDNPFAVRIIDKELAESYKHQFENLWKITTVAV